MSRVIAVWLCFAKAMRSKTRLVGQGAADDSRPIGPCFPERKHSHTFAAVIVVALLSKAAHAQEALDPLPSWNEGPVKKALVEFVNRVTSPTSPDFVKPNERIAVFDNDGTLWCEQPMYVELQFVFDRVSVLAAAKPEWKTTEPFKSLLAGDMEGVRKSGKRGLLEMFMATHSNVTVDDFEQTVKEYMKTAKHPRFKKPYTELIYQPMLEVLAYLRSQQFQTFIVSGGEVEFMRPFSEPVYGVPPQQVVGTSVKTEYQVHGDKPVLMRLPEIDFFDDGPGKPVAIGQYIGRRPLIAFGNSDGDFEMLEWTTKVAAGPRLGLIVHHTDGEREYAYDRDSQFGRLNKALDEAQARGWQVISMKDDWKEIFPPVKEEAQK